MFDVVCCHAVPEWLADPEETVEHLARFLRPEGCLSLMFYTATPRYSRGLWKGTSHSHSTRASRAEGSGAKGPRRWPRTRCANSWTTGGLRVRSKAGRRFLRDNVPEDLRRPERIGELLKAEKRLSSKEPFASLGQHTHLVCERSEV
jgi:S-adenosylmethionine-dependent methyltransferase